MAKPGPNKEGYVRKRNHFVNFRITPEEATMLDRYIALSGLDKQVYLADCMLHRTIQIQGNPRVFINLKKEMNEILNELKRINTSSEINVDLLKLIEHIAVLMEGLNK